VGLGENNAGMQVQRNVQWARLRGAVAERQKESAADLPGRGLRRSPWVRVVRVVYGSPKQLDPTIRIYRRMR